MSKRLFACFAAGVWLAGTAVAQEGMQFPPAQVQVATAALREMAPVVEVSGTVVSLNDSRIAAEINGVLVWLADVGTAVDQGEVIARIDPRLMRVAYNRAKANLLRLEVDHAFRERELKRTEELAQRNNVSATLLDEVRSLRDQASHSLDEARAQFERAEDDLERTEIRAAFAGHVTERLASVGEFVDVGEDVVRLVDTHRKEVALPSPIALTRFIRPGLMVSVASGGDVREHAVRAVVPVGDVVSRMVEVRLAVEEGDWIVGTPVQVSLPSADPVVAVAVPRDALVERAGQAHIFRVTADGTAEQIPVDARSVVGLWVSIAAGVEAGDQVIIRGAERLMPGQPVVIGPGSGGLASK